MQILLPAKTLLAGDWYVLVGTFESFETEEDRKSAWIDNADGNTSSFSERFPFFKKKEKEREKNRYGIYNVMEFRYLEIGGTANVRENKTA